MLKNIIATSRLKNKYRQGVLIKICSFSFFESKEFNYYFEEQTTSNIFCVFGDRTIVYKIQLFL